MQTSFKNLELDGNAVDIAVENGRIASITPSAPSRLRARPVVPAFYNCHTHLAMSLLRGYADDLELMPWLQVTSGRLRRTLRTRSYTPARVLRFWN